MCTKDQDHSRSETIGTPVRADISIILIHFVGNKVFNIFQKWKIIIVGYYYV